MVAPSLDEIDQQIITSFERDGRRSMRQLAEDVRISRANAYARLERLTTNGVITGFTAVVDPVARGFSTSAYVTMNIRQAEWRNIHSKLRELQGIEHIALVGGTFDVVLLVRARDNAGLGRLVLNDIQKIEGVLNTQTLLMFEESSPARPLGQGGGRGPALDQHLARLDAPPSANLSPPRSRAVTKGRVDSGRRSNN